MLEDVRQFTEFLVKYRITPNQFYLCWLLYWDHREYQGDKHRIPDDDSAMVNLYRYASIVGSWSKQEIEDLKEKDLIEDPRNTEKIDSMEVTHKFVDAVMATYEEQDEFWDAYPTWVTNFNNPSHGDVNLKTVNEEEVKRLYKQKVKTKDRHKRIMKILNWAKERDKINMNIKNFVQSRMWNQLEELMEKEGASSDSQYGNRTAL